MIRGFFMQKKKTPQTTGHKGFWGWLFGGGLV